MLAEVEMDDTTTDMPNEDAARLQVMGVITAFFVGAAAGAAMALLYAPNEGRRTRDLVGEKVRDLTDKIRRARWKAVDKAYKTSEAALPDVGVWPGTPAEASGEERPTGGN